MFASSVSRIWRNILKSPAKIKSQNEKFLGRYSSQAEFVYMCVQKKESFYLIYRTHVLTPRTTRKDDNITKICAPHSITFSKHSFIHSSSDEEEATCWSRCLPRQLPNDQCQQEESSHVGAQRTTREQACPRRTSPMTCAF